MIPGSKYYVPALVLKIVLAVLGMFVPALSGENDVVEIISIIVATDCNPDSVHYQSSRNASRSELCRKSIIRLMQR